MRIGCSVYVEMVTKVVHASQILVTVNGRVDCRVKEEEPRETWGPGGQPIYRE